jgi:tyramine---L-glutamate ligase
MQILIYEHVSGGGYVGKPIPADNLSEGFAMLRALLTDFKAAGHSVATLLDWRIAELNPPLMIDNLAIATSDVEAEKVFEQMAYSADAVCIIAPESDNMLERIVQRTESMNIPVLNCSPYAISAVTNKASFHKLMVRLGYSTPRSIEIGIDFSNEEIESVVQKQFGFPAIFKPLYGEGCSALSVIRNPDDIKNAMRKLRSWASDEFFLAQEQIQGKAASVSVYSNGIEALPVSLNHQNILLSSPESLSKYVGGTVPLDSPFREAAFSVAKKVTESVPGLRGYIGVDIVLTEQGPCVIEVNPRLTTSYVGLRLSSSLNLAQALVDSTLKHRIPVDYKTFGYACFEKVQVNKPNRTLFSKTCEAVGVFSPPFPVSIGTSTFALIIAHGETCQIAATKLVENKLRFQEVLQGKGE